MVLLTCFLGCLVILAELFGCASAGIGQACYLCDGARCHYNETVSEDDCEFGLFPEGTRYCCARRECPRGPYQTCGGPWEEKGRCVQDYECLALFPFRLRYDYFLSLPGRCLSVEQANQTYSNFSDFALQYLPAFKEYLSIKHPKCRPLCSHYFCRDGRNKYCSASGSIALNKVEERGPCQHTTCRACHFWAAPNPPCPSCPSPVTRRCLRHFYLCIDAHFRKNDIIWNMTNPKIHTSSGQFYCHVPEVTVVV